MRRLYGCLLVLISAVLVLVVGSVLPRVVLAGEGMMAYSGEREAFAEFALVYDSDLREWPFPVDPTVARRVTKVSGTHNENSPCNSRGTPNGSPYDTGYFVGDYKAEVVHYGPFFVTTGKNVFNCDGARTYSFFLPEDTDGILFGVLGSAMFIGAFGLAIASIGVPTFLTIGGGILLFGSQRGSHRVVGLAALLSGLALAAITFLAIAATTI